MERTSRELGVEFGRLEEALSGAAYPLTNEELLDEHGQTRIELPDNRVALNDVLAPLDGETYTNGNEVRQAVLNVIDERAIGRKHYSDRDPPTLGEERLGGDVSL